VALPGGLRVGYAEALPAKVFAVSFDGGFGYRSGLLADNHKMKRGIADVAFAYAATPWLTLGLSFDGRYDSHKGGGELTDNGWVGEPRLAARAVKAGGAVAFGGQLQLSAPGSDAPSVVPSALTVEARGLVSGQAGALRWAANARLPARQQRQLDRHARRADLGGPGLARRVRLERGGGRWAHRLPRRQAGARPRGRRSHLRRRRRAGPGGAGGRDGRRRPHPELALTGFVATNVVSKPAIGIDMMIPLQPYDPMIAFGVGLTARFGGVAPIGPTVDENPDEPDEPPAPVRASLRGVGVRRHGRAGSRRHGPRSPRAT
jgi:hypothetical protein